MRLEAIAALALAAGALATGCDSSSSLPGAPDYLAEISEALGTTRTTQARWSGLSHYAPFEGSLKDRISIDLSESLREQILLANNPECPSSALSDTAWLAATLDKPDLAIQLLEAARRKDPRSVTGGDLAAAYFLSGVRSGQLDALLRSLEEADNTWRRNRRDKTAGFNALLVLSHFGLAHEVKRHANELKKEQFDLGWSSEITALETAHGAYPPRQTWEEKTFLEAAIRRDQREVQRLVEISPRRSRRQAELELPEAWANLVATDADEEALESIAAANFIAEALSVGFQDQLASDALNRIYEASSGNRKKLQTGYQLLAKGRVQRRQSHLSDAVPTLELSARTLEEAGSPASFLADLERVKALRDLRQPQRAFAVASNLRLDIDATLYPSLVAEIDRRLGLLHVILGRPQQALTSYRDAARLFTEGRDTESLQEVESLLAECLETLGQTHEADFHHARSLKLARDSGDPQSLYYALPILGDSALKRGWPLAAARLYREAATVAASYGENEYQAELLVWLAESLGRAGYQTDALDHLSEARSLSEQTDDPERSQRLRKDIDLIEARLHVPIDPRGARHLLQPLISELTKADHKGLLLLALQALAKAAENDGDFAVAMETWNEAIRLFEGLDSDVLNESLRILWAEEPRAMYGELIRIHLDYRDDPTLALEVAERARTRALPAALLFEPLGKANAIHRLAAPTAPASAKAIADRIPAGITVVEFATLKDRLTIWLIQDGNVEYIGSFKALPAQDLDTKTKHFRSQLLGGSHSDAKRDASRLFDALVRPWINRVPPGRPLAIVRDKHLQLLPFAPLYDKSRGKYLVELHPLVMIPSAKATLSPKVASRTGEPLTAQSRLLAIGDPKFSSRRFPGLPRLPGALNEVRVVSQFFVQPSVLIGSNATKESFLEQLPGAEVLHTSAHLLVDAENPAKTSLPLAPKADEDGVVHLDDIYDLNLASLRIAILAGCETASSGSPTNEAVAGLARAFLAAGAGAIVASTAPISDSLSKELWLHFYESAFRAPDFAVALQEAQIAMIQYQDQTSAHPGSWGFFELYTVEISSFTEQKGR